MIRITVTVSDDGTKTSVRAEASTEGDCTEREQVFTNAVIEMVPEVLRETIRHVAEEKGVFRNAWDALYAFSPAWFPTVVGVAAAVWWWRDPSAGVASVAVGCVLGWVAGRVKEALGH